MGQPRSPTRSTAADVSMATHVPKPHSPQLRKASVQGKTILSRIPVSRVYNHQNNKILYEDMHGDLFTTSTLPYGHYPEEINLNVYESQGGRTFEYLDDWGSIYARATREDDKNITGQGISISQPRYRVPGQPPLRRADPIYPPTTSTLPRHVGFDETTSSYDPTLGKIWTLHGPCKNP